MGALFDTVVSFFKEEGWPSARLEGLTVLQLPVTSEAGDWTCFAQAREAEEQFVFYSRAPLAAPENQRAAVAEFLTRANYGLVLGNFEMDWSDGEIRFKTSIDVEGDRLTPALLRPLVYANVQTMGKYVQGIEAVALGRQSPVDAIAQIEG
jgi:hypothetical protein